MRRGTTAAVEAMAPRLARLGKVGLAPAVICIAHLFYGAAVPLAALILSACLLAVLAGLLLSTETRRSLDRLSPSWPIICLFAAVLLIALATLTPWAPGGLHPIWDWSGATASSTMDRSATVLEILKLIGLAAPFVIGAVLGARGETGRSLYAAILGVGGLYAMFSLVVFLSSAAPGSSGNRLAGGFESANVAGSVFGVLLIMAIAWAVRAWRRTPGMSLAHRTTAIAPTLALILLALGCLLLTASRGAIGATSLALALFFGWAAMDNRRSRWSTIAAGALVISVAAVVYIQGNTLFVDRFAAMTGDTTRADLLEPHWNAFLRAPLFGYGLGTWSEVNNQIMTSQSFDALSATVILHNVYVQWLEEAGIIGAAPMFLLIAVILGATGWRAYRRRRNRALIVGLLLATLVVLLHAAVDVSLNTPSFCAFWALLLGLGFGLSQAPSRSS